MTEPAQKIKPWSVEEENAIEEIAQGRGVLCNFDLMGPMLSVSAQPDGRGKVECPVEATPIQGPAHAEIVRKTLASWSVALAEYDRQQAEGEEPQPAS